MAHLRLFLSHRGTKSLRFPDHDFPVMRTCTAPAPQGRALSECPVFGHEERFPPTRPSAGFEFRKVTIAGMRRNRRDAPTAAARFFGKSRVRRLLCGLSLPE